MGKCAIDHGEELVLVLEVVLHNVGGCVLEVDKEPFLAFVHQRIKLRNADPHKSLGSLFFLLLSLAQDAEVNGEV